MATVDTMPNKFLMLKEAVERAKMNTRALAAAKAQKKPRRSRVEEEELKFKEIDERLKNAEFLYQEDLFDYLYTNLDVSDETLQRIRENSDSYPAHIQEALWLWEYMPPIKKMRLGELTDADMIRMEDAKEKARELLMEQAWAKYELPDRPENDADYACDEAWEILQEKKRDLAAYINGNKRGAAYVAPSMRREDPRAEELKEDIKKLENEFEKLKEKVIAEDEDWRILKKNEFRIKFMLGKMPSV
jgi:chromosome segregation ATPase